MLGQLHRPVQQQHTPARNRRRHRARVHVHRERTRVTLRQSGHRRQRTRQHRPGLKASLTRHCLVIRQHVPRDRHRQHPHRAAGRTHHLVRHHRIVGVEWHQLLQPEAHNRQRLGDLARQGVEIQQQHPHRSIRNHQRKVRVARIGPGPDGLHRPPHRCNRRHAVGHVARLQTRRNRTFRELHPGHRGQRPTRFRRTGCNYTPGSDLAGQARTVSFNFGRQNHELTFRLPCGFVIGSSAAPWTPENPARYSPNRWRCPTFGP